MFLLNVAYRWGLSTIDEVNGVLILPTGNTSERLTRAAGPEFQRVLLDPQLYLATLDCSKCPTTCARLATYPWFRSEIESFDSGETTRREWEQQVKERIGDAWIGRVPEASDRSEAARAAVEFQLRIPCTHLLLAAPLITEREDEAATIAEWIDAGLMASELLDVGQPLFATVAIDEGLLNDAAFDPGGFLDTLVDQVTAREGLEGVYLVVVQTQSKQHPFQTAPSVLRAYLRLSRSFRQAGLQVLVNFAGVFGEVCMAAGASGFASGASQSHCRLSFSDFDEPSFGIPLPKFYSHRVIGEFQSETELNVIARRRLFRRIRDITPYSQPLVEAIESGGSAADVPEWAESKNNTAASHRHFVARLATEASELHSMSPRQRHTAVRDWLDEASANHLLLEERLDREISPMCAPSNVWLELLDQSVDDH